MLNRWMRFLLLFLSISEYAFSKVITSKPTSVLVSRAVSTNAPEIIKNLPPGSWLRIPNSKLNQVKANPDACLIPELSEPGKNGSCSFSGILDYSGGAFDSKRNRLIVWGGGHSGYAGAEIYVFDVPTLKWIRLNEPKVPNTVDQPISVHSYDHLVYLPNTDELFAPGGSQFGAGGAVQDTWLFNFSTMKWSNRGTMPLNNPYSFGGFSLQTDFDPLTKKVIVVGVYKTAAYDSVAKKWDDQLFDAGKSDNNQTGAFDPVRRNFVAVGRGAFDLSKIDSTGHPTSKTSLVTTGDQSMKDCDAPGFVYDSRHDRFVGYCRGKEGALFVLNPNTWVWTKILPKSGGEVPPWFFYDANNQPSEHMFTFGRFAYIPDYDVFITVNAVDDDVFVFRLP